MTLTLQEQVPVHSRLRCRDRAVHALDLEARMTTQVPFLRANLRPGLRVLRPRIWNFTRRLQLRNLVPDRQRRIL